MSNVDILSILKFAGIAVTAGAAIWSMVSRQTYEDRHGRKRLTRAGVFAVALALVSALISATSFGFETLARQAEKVAETERRTRQAFEESQRESRRISEAAEARAAATENLVATLQAESASRTRDLELARAVSQASAASLAKAQLALGQLRRLLQPLGAIEIELKYVFDAAHLRSQALERLQGAIDERNRDPINHSNREVRFPVLPRSPIAPIDTVHVHQASPYFPSPADDLYRVIMAPDIALDLTRNGTRQEVENREARQLGLYFRGDLSFSLSGDSSEVAISYTRPSSIELTMTSRIEDRTAFRTGEIGSITDLEESNPVVTLQRRLGFSDIPPDLALENVHLTVGGRVFQFEASEFEAEVGGDRTYFVVGKMPTYRLTRSVRARLTPNWPTKRRITSRCVTGFSVISRRLKPCWYGRPETPRNHSANVTRDIGAQPGLPWCGPHRVAGCVGPFDV